MQAVETPVLSFEQVKNIFDASVSSPDFENARDSSVTVGQAHEIIVINDISKQLLRVGSTDRLYDHKSVSVGDDLDNIARHQFALYFFDQHCLIEETGFGSGLRIAQFLIEAGLLKDDPRFKTMHLALIDGHGAYRKDITEKNFIEIVVNSTLPIFLEHVFRQRLVVPDFSLFSEKVQQIFEKVAVDVPVSSGAPASYIPQLGKVDPNLFGFSICTIDGQRFNYGHCDTKFSIQSCIKPITYGIALEQHGEEYVHKHIGREPSGVAFNSLCLNPSDLPHNPLINSGAIMSCALIGHLDKQGSSSTERFETVLSKVRDLSGGSDWSFSNSIYLSEKEGADANVCLAYMMRGKNILPEGVDIQKTLDFYFQCCSLETTTNNIAILGATLAKGGVCPLTGKQVFKAETCRSILSQMYSSGMYDYSGEWAYVVGIPAKSGIYAIIPDLGCISIYSPPLDKIGNSVRGIAFYKELVKAFCFHTFDSSLPLSNSKFSQRANPRCTVKEEMRTMKVNSLYACAEGDLSELKRLIIAGCSVNTSDYDRRSLLHLAASEGHYALVKYLLRQPDISVNVKDRWNQTPLDDAKANNHPRIVTLLESFCSLQNSTETEFHSPKK